MTSGDARPGGGFTSIVRTPQHTVYRWRRWWTSEERFNEYRLEQNRRRRAHQAGYELGQVEMYMEKQREASDLIAERKRYDYRVKRIMSVIRLRYNMGAHTNRAHFKAMYERTGDSDIKLLLNMISTAPLNDTQKLERIRKMFLDKKPPAEILYSTALMVGINLRKN